MRGRGGGGIGVARGGGSAFSGMNQQLMREDGQTEDRWADGDRLKSHQC